MRGLLQSQFRNPNFYSFVSHFHNRISRRPPISNPAIEFVLNEAREFQSSRSQLSSPAQNEEVPLPHGKKFQIPHPWQEWVDLMVKLFKNGYFDAIGNPFNNNQELGCKEANLIRTACLNYARDQYELIRYLSRDDILVVAGSGCPSTDRKVVNSGKRLRAHVGIDEGNVCSSCILRGNCERAYVRARKDEGGRTVDVMRLLLTYGLDPLVASVENKPCLNKKVKESVRILLKEIVGIRVEGIDQETPKTPLSEGNLSAQENDSHKQRREVNVPLKQGDWICTKCSFLNFSRNIKCLSCGSLSQERLVKLAMDQDHLPLKKGDWICDTCNFLNFARNTKCLLCKEKPPRRSLNPGEWECESCNYINFRRNMVCLKCDHRRAIALHASDDADRRVTDNGKNHKVNLWFAQEAQSRIEGDNPLEFVESEYQDERISSSLNQDQGFVDFPIVGGKSDLSQDLQKQELWKIEVAKKGRAVVKTREGAGSFNSGIFHERDEYLGNINDDMAEWFTGRKDDKGQPCIMNHET